MTALKTRPTRASVTAFIRGIEDEQKQRDCKVLLQLMQKLTDQKPCMWGESIVGFGRYHYKYASGREGDWFITGFSPRKQNLSIYIMPGFKSFQSQLKKLGKHKTSVSCLYIRKLDDIDLDILEAIIDTSIKKMHEIYNGKS